MCRNCMQEAGFTSLSWLSVFLGNSVICLPTPSSSALSFTGSPTEKCMQEVKERVINYYRRWQKIPVLIISQLASKSPFYR